MSKEYRVKVFKSGNSLAIRLPKSLSLHDGQEMVVVRHDDGTLTFWPESENARKLDSLYGAFSAGFMSEGRGDIEQAERDWDRSPRDAAA